MKRGLIIVLWLINVISCLAQNISLDDVTFSPTDTIPGSYVPRSGYSYLFIASGFGSSQVTKTASLDSVSGFRINEIVLVYSRYHKKDDFNQARLNDFRWNNLFRTYPGLFSGGATQFYEVCQDVITDSSARKLTHGFYIYYQNPGDSMARHEEIRKLSDWMSEIGIDAIGDRDDTIKETEDDLKETDSLVKRAKHYSLFKIKDPKGCRQPFYKSGPADLESFFRLHVQYSKAQLRKPKDLFAEVRLKIDERGMIKNASILTVSKQLVGQIKNALYKMEPWNPAVRDGKIIKTDVKITLYCNAEGIISLKEPVVVPAYLSKCALIPDDEMFDFSGTPDKKRTVRSAFQVEDPTIVKDVVRRTSVRELLVVVDVTGSMGPYIAQVIELMNELLVKDDPHVSAITLFNDGDNRPDKSKVIGKTGGVYTIKGEITAEELGRSVLRSMKRGSGGDCMENNLEALLDGLKECPLCEDVIMVADNFATPRDMSLLPGVKKPVHWIVCGAVQGINVHYLDLIRANAGVLHTAGSDVTDLHLLKDDDIIEVDGFRYQLIRGRFKARK